MRDETIRVDPAFKKILKESSVNRVKNDVDKEMRSTRELTKMMLNTPSIEKVIGELESIPRKEDLG